MMIDRPFFGYGWGKAEEVYQKKYCPPNLDDGAAIQMNDYLMLGISGGIPALICFLFYVALSLRSRPCSVSRVPCSENAILDPRRSILQATCRAGAIVLLVGFWFDGGLFKLATGSVFWILLELGRIEPRMGTKEHEEEVPSSIRLRPTTARQVPEKHRDPTTNDPGSGAQRTDAPYQRGLAEQWLRRAVWGIAVLALLETIVLVGAPFLPVSRASLAIARHWLVPPKAVGDLDLLAAETVLADGHQSLPGPDRRDARATKIKLGVLVQHASLANYNRQLINWSVEDVVYRDYVLWPGVYQGRGSGVEGRVGDLNWRRALWEYFYPPVRHENDPMAAAGIVLKYLRERVTVESPKSNDQGLRSANVPGQETGAPMQQIRTGGTPVPLSLTIEEMWKQRRADAEGFEALKVAAFRSVGIPARLNENGQAEVFEDRKWQVGPR
jgi:hypothetical protein